MSFQKQFEELIRQVHDLEKAIFTAKDMDIIPLSFFSTSIDSLNQLKAGIHEIELAQFNLMQEHLKKTGESISNQPEKIKEKKIPEKQKETENPVEIKEEEIVVSEVKKPKEVSAPENTENTPVSESKVFLSDTITKNKLTDFKKSLSLNERFMFQRDLFQNSADKMNQALETINSFDSLSDALNYLNSNYPIQWESEAGTIFRELLEKRFI